MATKALDLWSLVLDQPQVDPSDLAEAVLQQVEEDQLDYRTRLLIRDSVDALRQVWHPSQVERWLSAVPLGNKVRHISSQPFDEVGFPSLRSRLMEKTRPERVRQFLETVGQQLAHPVRIEVAGSVALIMTGYLDRRTEDIDVVGEVPKEIRENHPLTQKLQQSFSLYLGHVQTHYFPRGWRERVHSLGTFGKLQVFLVDVYDVFLSKLFSARLKDQEDLRMLAPRLDKPTLERKLKEDAVDFLALPRLLGLAQDNWQILFGEPLPS